MESSKKKKAKIEARSADLGRFGVCVVGVGVIGTNSVKVMVEAGIGSIRIIDRDFVESKNLSVQKLFSAKDVGMPKAIAAKTKLEKVKSRTKIFPEVKDLDCDNVGILSGSDMVLDCTDNFETRFLINDFCRKNRIPWIHSAAIRKSGTVYSINADSPCFRCIFNNHKDAETCDTAGVDENVVSEVAFIQTAEAIKILTGKSEEKKLLRISPSGILKLKVRKNPNCKACKGNYEFLEAGKSRIVKLCGTNNYQIKGNPVDLRKLSKKPGNQNATDFGYCIHSDGITVFKDGRAFVKANSPEKAKLIYKEFLEGNRLSAL